MVKITADKGRNEVELDGDLNLVIAEVCSALRSIYVGIAQDAGEEAAFKLWVKTCAFMADDKNWTETELGKIHSEEVLPS